MSTTPPGGTATTPEACAAHAPEREAVPPQRTGLDRLPRRVRGASRVIETGHDAEPVDEATLRRLLEGLREI
jgi:hypothetical protein